MSQTYHCYAMSQNCKVAKRVRARAISSLFVSGHIGKVFTLRASKELQGIVMQI